MSVFPLNKRQYCFPLIKYNLFIWEAIGYTDNIEITNTDTVHTKKEGVPFLVTSHLGDIVFLVIKMFSAEIPAE